MDINRDTLTCFDNTLELNEYSTKITPAVFTVEKIQTAVSSVALDRDTLTLKEGENAKLTATVIPAEADNTAVSWSSDNPSVATVAADGTVTAIQSGTATITVTTEDGGKTASCAVTVTCAHVMEKTEAVAPGCETDGNVEYFSCSKCGKKFADEVGATEVTDVVIKAKGHTGSEWQMDEESHWGVCSVCGKDLKEAHTYASDADSDCDVCGYKRFYIVISGGNSVYEIGSDSGLTIMVDGDYGLFKDVEVDGSIIDSTNYDVGEGSTVITLKKAYLDALSAGEHTIRILYTDGKAASATFTVKAKTDNNNGGNGIGNIGGNNTGNNGGNNTGNNSGNNAGDNTEGTNADTGSGAQTPQEQSSEDSPKTGEVTRVSAWIILAVSGLVLVVGLFIYEKKMKK